MSVFKTASVFSNHMVLQRDRNISVFGTGNNGNTVTVTFRGSTVTAEVIDGQWRASLPPVSAGSGYTLTVSCGSDSVSFTDVAVGEVWLAGGQSNMELELRNCAEWNEVRELPPDEQLRFYYTQKNAFMDDAFYAGEEASHWTVSGGDDMEKWSAVAYFFAAMLRRELDVPVGIIGCNWGGTSASAWMDMESLSRDEELSSYVSEYLDAIRGKTTEQQLCEYAEYTAYHAEFERKMSELYSAQPDIDWGEALKIVGECRYPGPMNCANPFRPAGLYECMLKRVCPYSLRGFIYYQGESDDHKPFMYRRLFGEMISCWRREWDDDALPFIFVQLPMHRYKGEPDKKNWFFIREAQSRVFSTVRNTGIAVALDQGEWNEIHPKTKHTVGQRLAMQALCNVYGVLSSQQAYAPMLRRCDAVGGSLHLSFDYAEAGFICPSGVVSGFEIAGPDRKYHPASAVLDGNCIILSCNDVPKPLYARYLFTNYGDVSLFGSNGIPLMPFRTSFNDGSEAELISQ